MSIFFSLDQTEKVTLKIYDLNGRLISNLASKTLEKGDHRILYNTEALNAGVYFLYLETGHFLKTGKLVVTK